MYKQVFAFLILLYSVNGSSQNNLPDWNNKVASDINFIGWIGTEHNGDDRVKYCLHGHNFLNKRADGYKEFIINWITKNPEANIVPVASAMSKTQENSSIFLNCWIVNGEENLNVLLVEKGFFPATGVIRFKTWDELSESEKKEASSYEDLLIDIIIVREEYDEFLGKVNSAEAYAKKNMLGIWKD